VVSQFRSSGFLIPYLIHHLGLPPELLSFKLLQTKHFPSLHKLQKWSPTLPGPHTLYHSFPTWFSVYKHKWPKPQVAQRRSNNRETRHRLGNFRSLAKTNTMYKWQEKQGPIMHYSCVLYKWVMRTDWEWRGMRKTKTQIEKSWDQMDYKLLMGDMSPKLLCIFILYGSTRKWKQANFCASRHISSKCYVQIIRVRDIRRSLRQSNRLFIFFHWGTSIRIWLAIF
jgi:hypothetical protein